MLKYNVHPEIGLVLNNRLVTFLQNKDVHFNFQIGFSAHCRMSDHVLNLEPLIDKYSEEN